MPRLNPRKLRRDRRAALGPALEALERREVLSYSPLGYSLPDLSVKGTASPVAAWGGDLTVNIDAFNTGASTITEPLNQTVDSASSADAPASIVYIFASTRPGGKNAVLVGAASVPSIPQNNFAGVSETITLPARPAGFPGSGGKIYLSYAINPLQTFVESDFLNNDFVNPTPVTIQPALPDLQLVSFLAPSPLQPGDVIQPSIQIVNTGAVAAQGFQVQIVASQDKFYGPGDAILADYTVDSLAPLSSVATTSTIGGADNLTPTSNVLTLDSDVITLPSTPSTYYLGVKIDPLGAVPELGYHAPAAFDAVIKVTTIPGLPTSVTLNTGSSGSPSPYVFPYPLSTYTATASTSTPILRGVSAD